MAFVVQFCGAQRPLVPVPGYSYPGTRVPGYPGSQISNCWKRTDSHATRVPGYPGTWIYPREYPGTKDAYWFTPVLPAGLFRPGWEALCQWYRGRNSYGNPGRDMDDSNRVPRVPGCPGVQLHPGTPGTPGSVRTSSSGVASSRIFLRWDSSDRSRDAPDGQGSGKA
eukprot:1780352-Rhodomonas_salina.1